MYLYDVNLLVALANRPHELHEPAIKWLSSKSDRSWASCDITESGFIRISSNPAAFNEPRTPKQAWQILRGNIERSTHQHLTYSPSPTYEETLRRCQGYRQVTDAFLIAMAIDNGVTFATFDQKLKHLSPDPSAVEIIPIF